MSLDCATDHFCLKRVVAGTHTHTHFGDIEPLFELLLAHFSRSPSSVHFLLILIVAESEALKDSFLKQASGARLEGPLVEENSQESNDDSVTVQALSSFMRGIVKLRLTKA